MTKSPPDDAPQQARTPEAGGAGKMVFGWRFFKRDLFANIVIVAILIFGMEAWSWYAPPYIMPPPERTGVEIVRILSEDVYQMLLTIFRLFVAIVFALVIGSALGVLMGMIKWLQPYLKSLIIIDTGVPALSWMLFAIFWFKDEEARLFFILAVILLPFYALNVYDGIQNLSRDLIEAVETFRPTKWQIFRLLILPHIVPYILMTTKSIIGYATRMTVFAETISASSGMGAQMQLAQDNFNMSGVIGWTILLVILNLSVQALVTFSERKLLKWRPEVSVR
ncbi:MAG: ABC transporter permease subunit [Rhodospirillaceae bacterium]